MFQHVFAEMNDMLDEIIKGYPSAEGLDKQEAAAQMESAQTHE